MQAKQETTTEDEKQSEREDELKQTRNKKNAEPIGSAAQSTRRRLTVTTKSL